MSFSLWTVFAELSQKTKPDPAGRNRAFAFLQTTDELGAQVALLQSLVSPVVRAAHQNIQTLSSQKFWAAPQSDCSAGKNFKPLTKMTKH
jgi:hypothetical protein